MNDSIKWPFQAPLGAFQPELDILVPGEGVKPVDYAKAVGEAYLSYSNYEHRKSGGHYLTPPAIARFMAGSSSYSRAHLRVLDPGSGTGILSAAVCEAVCGGTVKSLHVEACEPDPLLADLTNLVLALSRNWLAQRGIALTYQVRRGDFVLEYANALSSTSRTDRHLGIRDEQDNEYDLVISNPPYFKIGKDDPRAAAWPAIVYGQPNIYALFMAISAELLSESGRLVYIVPRSFASGPYFRKFREVFFQRITPVSIHLFESRKDVFKSQTVLQESLVFAGRRRREDDAVDGGQVLLSHSKGAGDLANRRSFSVDMDSVLDPLSENRELSIPTRKAELELVRGIRAWPNTVRSLGLEISTGPVVPFRATSFLNRDANGTSAAPLLWMHHVQPMRTEWPAAVNGKPHWIEVSSESAKLLLEDANYVLLRRFSAKEEKRRLVAAPLLRGSLNTGVVGLENHLNYIRGVSRELDEELAYGLAALLNSTFLDRYFRVSNGNTQVSATELRAMPLPAEQEIRVIGAGIANRHGLGTSLQEIDAIVARQLNLSTDLLLERQPETE